jgi:hypothetical protein
MQCFFSLEYRYQLVLMRARFDANKDVKDTRMAQYLLADGCRQAWANRFPMPYRCWFEKKFIGKLKNVNKKQN